MRRLELDDDAHAALLAVVTRAHRHTPTPELRALHRTLADAPTVLRGLPVSPDGFVAAGVTNRPISGGRETVPATPLPGTVDTANENGRESVTRSPARTSALPLVDAAPEGAECRGQPLGATGSGV